MKVYRAVKIAEDYYALAIVELDPSLKIVAYEETAFAAPTLRQLRDELLRATEALGLPLIPFEALPS